MFLGIAILTYLASGIASLIALTSEYGIRSWHVYLFAFIGLLAHTVAIVANVSVDGMLQMSLLNSVSICVWMAIAVILFSTLTKPLQNLFTMIMPGAAVILSIGLFMPQLSAPKDYSVGMLVHIFVSLLAYSVIVITTVQAILVHLQTNDLHNHRFNNKFTKFLPPLQSMEKLMFEWLIIGFALLTLAIGSGAVFVENLLAQDIVHKTLLTVVAWGFFGLLIFGHIHMGWRGLRASKLIYIGFGFLLTAFIGSKFVLEYVLLRQL